MAPPVGKRTTFGEGVRLEERENPPGEGGFIMEERGARQRAARPGGVGV